MCCSSRLLVWSAGATLPPSLPRSRASPTLHSQHGCERQKRKHGLRTPRITSHIPDGFFPPASSADFPAISSTAFRSGSLENTPESSPRHRPRTIPSLSTRKNNRLHFPPYITPYALMAFSFMSLRSGYGNWSESANAFCEKGRLSVIPRSWTFNSSNFL